ncbi:beta-glucoside-specific PTS transporter subunit IIABC [Salibacterium qingdaonense]|uniref:PTS system, beta-glucosides-specific IIC component n=1 Tax=Salibacterium qingdaonense TaxID=266892 RepID=A0A1I4LFR4_9BACI|nr:beta-glucoside-specific PTS transporter subunit IIABC [Salibacterium qingdaonense]SFL89663.1 PTS system, beta-glucosides-specific IIC component [Salibacterium qingdaonense]
MKKDFQSLAGSIIENVGGEENVQSVYHCATRLRFILHDNEKADKQTVDDLEGVLQVVESGGQFQVVIGNEVSDVYKAITKTTSLGEESSGGGGNEEKGSLFNRAIDIIAGIFTPILGALAGAGIFKGLLAVLESTNLLATDSGTYQILNAASDSLFYFLPFLLAVTAARKFEGDPYVALVIAGALFYPDLITFGEEQGTMSFLGIPVIMADYSTSVIPILISIYIMSKFQGVLNNWLHSSIRMFFTPLILLLVMVPLTLAAFGPVGTVISGWLADGYTFVFDLSPVIAGIIMGVFWQVLVIFGLHWGFVPIGINNISVYGEDTFSAIIAPAVFAQAGAALGVWLKTRQTGVKAIAGPAAISGLFGVTEPAIYGINLRYKRPFVLGAAAGGAGGAIVGLSGATALAVGLPGLTTLPIYFGEGFALFCVAIAVSFVLAAVLTFFFGYSDARDGGDEEDTKSSTSGSQDTDEKTPSAAGSESQHTISSPLEGAVIPLGEVNDAAFSSEALGKGVAVIPVSGKLYAPADGTISTVFPTKHAYGLTTEAGVDILMHIGLDTVQLDGQHFTSHVQQDQVVKKGELLAEFDVEGIKNNSFDIATPVIITNSGDYYDILGDTDGNVTPGDPVLSIIR